LNPHGSLVHALPKDAHTHVEPVAGLLLLHLFKKLYALVPCVTH
jgi:hypothetical protein